MSALRPDRHDCWLIAWPMVALAILGGLAPTGAQEPFYLRTHYGRETAVTVAISHDGKTLFTYIRAQRPDNHGNTINFDAVCPWNLTNNSRMKDVTTTAIPPGGASSVFSPDDRNLALVGANGNVVVLDAATWLDRLTLKTPKVIFGKAAYSPDSKVLIAAGRETVGDKDVVGIIVLWDANRGKELASFRGLPSPIQSMALSPDGKTLAAGLDDGTIQLWDLEAIKDQSAKKERALLKGHEGRVECVAFGPDGKTLVSGGMDKTVRLWDLAASKETTSLIGHARPVFFVAILADGTTPLSGSSDGTVRIWDVAGEKERTILKPYTGVIACALSADGKVLAVGGSDGSQVYPLPGKPEPKPEPKP